MLWESGSRWAKFCEISSYSVKYGMYAINSMSHFRFFCFKFLSPQCHKQTPLGYRKLNDMSMKSYVHLSAAKICESWTAWNCTSVWQSGKHENSMTITIYSYSCYLDHSETFYVSCKTYLVKSLRSSLKMFEWLYIILLLFGSAKYQVRNIKFIKRSK